MVVGSYIFWELYYKNCYEKLKLKLTLEIFNVTLLVVARLVIRSFDTMLIRESFNLHHASPGTRASNTEEVNLFLVVCPVVTGFGSKRQQCIL